MPLPIVKALYNVRENIRKSKINTPVHAIATPVLSSYDGHHGNINQQLTSTPETKMTLVIPGWMNHMQDQPRTI